MTALLLFAAVVAAEPAVQSAWQPVLERHQMPAAPQLSATGAAHFHPTQYRRPLWDLLAADPLLAPTLAETGSAGFQRDADRLAANLERLGQRANLGVTRSLENDVPALLAQRLGPDDPLGTALTSLRQAAGGVAKPANDPATADLPPALNRALGLLVAAGETSLTWRQRAFEEQAAGSLGRAINDLKRFSWPGDSNTAGPQSFEHQRRLDWLAAGLDVPALAAAAADVALVFDAVRDDLKPIDGFTARRWSTPLGDVVLAGSGPDQHGGEAPLLLVDLGGDDTYSGGAAAVSDQRPLSMVIDVAGNDTYTAESGLGAAVGGVALQADLSGDDTYTAGSLSLGCGVGGVGMLFDGGGNDRYAGSQHSQGAGAYGLGLLVDVGGDDSYTLDARGQGFGYVLGAGLLLDAGEGRDEYSATGTGDTLAQGSGFGRRSDSTDGHSLAGGLGWLADGGGNDVYRTGGLSQGSGYAYGIGVLTDAGGDDERAASGTSLGAGRQAGIGLAWDGGGDDRWQAEDGLGAGLDFGLGWLIDAAGVDRYTLARVGLGAAVANGLAFAWDQGAGADEYRAEGSLALGRGQDVSSLEAGAFSLRRGLPTLGLWLDGGGANRYTGRTKPEAS